MGIICLEYCESFQTKTTDFYGNNFDWHFHVIVICINVTHDVKIQNITFDGNEKSEIIISIRSCTEFS